MKTILEYLYNRKRAIKSNSNKFNITKKDLIGELEGFPISVVIRMLEEQEAQKNKPDVTVFQRDRCSSVNLCGFHWDKTEAGRLFWQDVITHYKFNKFYQKYPEYKKYDL